ncbi:hypothetical protein D3C87_2180320 [compost metagenome]
MGVSVGEVDWGAEQIRCQIGSARTADSGIHFRYHTLEELDALGHIAGIFDVSGDYFSSLLHKSGTRLI